MRREAATRAAFHFGQCVYLGGHFSLAPLIAQLGGEESVYLLPLGAADADRLWLVSPVEDRLSKQGQPLGILFSVNQMLYLLIAMWVFDALLVGLTQTRAVLAGMMLGIEVVFSLALVWENKKDRK